MRKIFLSLLPFALCGSVAAAVPDTALERALPKCSLAAKLSRQPFTQKLPPGFTGEWVVIDSEDHGCAGQYAAITAPNGDFYVGLPWLISQMAGTTEQKIKSYGWERLQGTFAAKLGKDKSKQGLTRVDVAEKTEYGEAGFSGWADDAGLIFFPGDFTAKGSDPAADRLAVLNRLAKSAPTVGDASAKVWIVEFSDFQCPSCKAVAGDFKPILDKYKGKVRYTRIDYPLMSIHPWAFPAAVSARAIYRQNPEQFWKFKDTVYEQQSKLSPFTVDQVGADFVAGMAMDEKRYAAEVNSKELREEILAGVGATYTLNVLATPTFFVNGVAVSPGPHATALDKHIASLLGQ